jgi:hypothetical protein
MQGHGSPIKAHQISLQGSLIGSEYQPIRGRGQLFWVCGKDTEKERALPSTFVQLIRYLALPAVVASGTSTSFPDFTS